MRTVVDEFITTFRFIKVGDKAVAASVDAMNAKLNQSVALMGRNSLLWAAGFAFVGKSAGKLEDQIIGMANQARTDTDSMWGYNEALKAIGDTAGVSGQKMREALDSVVQRTGNIEFAITNAQLLADLVRGGRMNPSQAGEVISSFFTQFDETDPVKIRKIADELTYMAKVGSLPIAEMGDILPRLFGSMKMAGINDLEDAANQVSVLSQVVNAITIKSSRTGTSIENFVTDISKNIEKVNELTGMAFTGNEGPLNILLEIVKALGDDSSGSSKMSELFGGEQMKSNNVIKDLSEFLNRRGMRVGAAGMSADSLIKRLNESKADAQGTLDRDRRAYVDTIYTTIAALGNLIEALKEKLAVSGAISKALQTLDTVLRPIVGLLTILPNFVWQAVLTLAMLNFVITKGLIAGLYKMIAPLSITLVEMMLLTEAGFGLALKLEALSVAMITRLIPATWSLNAAMMLNPIGAVLTAVALLIIGLASIVMWLMKIKKNHDIKINADLDTSKITAKAGSLENLLSGVSNPLAMNPEALQSMMNQNMASSISPSSINNNNAARTIVTTINVDAKGSSDVASVEEAARRGTKEALAGQYNLLYNELSAVGA